MDLRATVTRAGYATVASAYAEHLSDELAHKPLDRALLDAFAEQTRDAGLATSNRAGMSDPIRSPR